MKSFESCYFDFLVGEGIATEEEIQLVTNINGWSSETMDDILCARTGNRSIDQYADENYVDLSMYGIEWSEDEDEDEVSGVGMTVQQKEDHFKRRGYKVLHVYSSANPYGVIELKTPSGFSKGPYDSVNQAHKRIFGY